MLRDLCITDILSTSSASPSVMVQLNNQYIAKIYINNKPMTDLFKSVDAEYITHGLDFENQVYRKIFDDIICKRGNMLNFIRPIGAFRELKMEDIDILLNNNDRNECINTKNTTHLRRKFEMALANIVDAKPSHLKKLVEEPFDESKVYLDTSKYDQLTFGMIITRECKCMTLIDHVNTNALYPDDIVSMTGQIGTAMFNMNDHGMTHMDLHSSNILVEDLGSPITIFVLDAWENIIYKTKTRYIYKLFDFDLSQIEGRTNPWYNYTDLFPKQIDTHAFDFVTFMEFVDSANDYFTRVFNVNNLVNPYTSIVNVLKSMESLDLESLEYTKGIIPMMNSRIFNEYKQKLRAIRALATKERDKYDNNPNKKYRERYYKSVPWGAIPRSTLLKFLFGNMDPYDVRTPQMKITREQLETAEIDDYAFFTVDTEKFDIVVVGDNNMVDMFENLVERNINTNGENQEVQNEENNTNSESGCAIS